MFPKNRISSETKLKIKVTKTYAFYNVTCYYVILPPETFKMATLYVRQYRVSFKMPH